MARKNGEKNERLVELLWILKDKRKINDFCLNRDGTYNGNYQQPYLSDILRGIRNGSKHYNRCIITDIENYLLSLK